MPNGDPKLHWYSMLSILVSMQFSTTSFGQIKVKFSTAALTVSLKQGGSEQLAARSLALAKEIDCKLDSTQLLYITGITKKTVPT